MERLFLALILLATLALPGLAQPAGQDLADPPEPDEKHTSLPVEVIQVSGSTLIPQAELDALVARYQGQRLTLAERQALTREIEALYRDRGYLLVDALVPAQGPERGILKVAVVEGTLGEVRVEGNQRYPSDFLIDRFEAAVPESEATSSNFQRAMFLLNELPDLAMQVELTPGTVEGTTDLILKAREDKNVHVTTGFNNFGATLTGEYRFALGLDASSVLTPGDLLVAGALLSTPSDNTVFAQGAYSLPVNDQGTRLGFIYSSGAYTMGREVRVLDVRGTADVFALNLSHPLTRGLSHTSDLSMRVAYNELHDTIMGEPLSSDRYFSASLGYKGEWRDASGSLLGELTLTQGLGGTKNGDPLASRLNAGSEFTKLNLDLTRLQELNDQWLLVLRGSAQFSPDSLFSAEQFALGGADTVRGFSQAEVLGDQAYATTLELRWSPLKENPDLFQTVFFLDHGAVTSKSPLPDEDDDVKLTGAGLGFRWSFDQTRLRLDLGFPISPKENLRGNSPVLYGQIETRF